MMMYRPELDGDTLIGVVRGQGMRKILRSDVREYHAKVPAPGRTWLVTIAGVALVGTGVFYVVKHTGHQTLIEDMADDQLVQP